VSRIEEYPHEPLHSWRPRAPGRIEHIYTHWSGYDYASVFPAYNYCITLTRSGAIVVETNDPRNNMRDVYAGEGAPYAAHTYQRNSFAIGIAMMGMQDASPQDFGAYPLTVELVDALCSVGARLAAFYGIPIDADRVMSHAEAALRDGYFGQSEDERWDIARLVPDARPLTSQDALDTGEELRARMRNAR
jgi:hypothetical protein